MQVVHFLKVLENRAEMSQFCNSVCVWVGKTGKTIPFNMLRHQKLTHK